MRGFGVIAQGTTSDGCLPGIFSATEGIRLDTPESGQRQDNPEPEQWRPVPVAGYEHAYEVSSLGRFRRLIPGQGTRVGRILRPRTAANGYPIVGLSVVGLGKSTTRHVHELVALAFLGPRPDGHEVAHRNHVRSDNRLSNLRWRPMVLNRADVGPKACGVCGAQGHYSNNRTFHPLVPTCVDGGAS